MVVTGGSYIYIYIYIYMYIYIAHYLEVILFNNSHNSRGWSKTEGEASCLEENSLRQQSQKLLTTGK